MTPRPFPRIPPRLLPPTLAALALALLTLGAGEYVAQQKQDEYVRAAAREALEGAAGGDFESKVAALRDYVRARVRNVDFGAKGRPFLRDTAAETLRSGRGRCGEATRVFVNLARAAGIPAQRLYLEGRKAHVVAAVADGRGGAVIVDAANRFYFPEVEPLGGLARHAEFDSYSTFGWRRLGPLRALPSNFVSLGPLGYLFENPHALLACLSFVAAAAALALAALLQRRLPLRRARRARERLAVHATS
ncbi:MAG TPA: transglutaminase-like domain-containing protein [Pyrinomonadaceae bacterium]|jgi:transglutaminase-like putative cysteine protease